MQFWRHTVYFLSLFLLLLFLFFFLYISSRQQTNKPQLSFFFSSPTQISVCARADFSIAAVHTILLSNNRAREKRENRIQLLLCLVTSIIPLSPRLGRRYVHWTFCLILHVSFTLTCQRSQDVDKKFRVYGIYQGKEPFYLYTYTYSPSSRAGLTLFLSISAQTWQASICMRLREMILHDLPPFC